MLDLFYDVTSWVLPVLLAVTLHEAAHGWMALRYGDPTAKMLGRVTFNPIKHIDKTGTIILPGLLLAMSSPILFGYAKPVPVNFNLLQPARMGQFMVAIAGVCVNFALMVASAALLHLETIIAPEDAPWLFACLYKSVLMNAVLIVFNMIPLLPLDGGRAVDAWLSGFLRRLYRKTERFGIWVVMLALGIPLLVGSDLPHQWLGTPIFWLVEHVLWLTGVADLG